MQKQVVIQPTNCFYIPYIIRVCVWIYRWHGTPQIEIKINGACSIYWCKGMASMSRGTDIQFMQSLMRLVCLHYTLYYWRWQTKYSSTDLDSEIKWSTKAQLYALWLWVREVSCVIYPLHFLYNGIFQD